VNIPLTRGYHKKHDDLIHQLWLRVHFSGTRVLTHDHLTMMTISPPSSPTSPGLSTASTASPVKLSLGPPSSRDVHTCRGAPVNAKLVQITPITSVYGTCLIIFILNGGYKPTSLWGHQVNHEGDSMGKLQPLDCRIGIIFATRNRCFRFDVP
jgi:hypothetical protein